MGAACCTEFDKAAAIASAGHNGAAPRPLEQQPLTAQQPPAQPPAGPILPALSSQGGVGDGGKEHVVGGDRLISQVGELPKFSKASPTDLDGGISETSSVRSGNVDGLSDVVSEVTTRQQRHEAKQVVKEFVTDMRKGRKMTVMTQSGQLKTCSAYLNRGLDTFSIKVGGQKRNILLKDVEEIHAGSEQIEGVDTPLDELCATLMLVSDDCITFRLNDVNARDTFVMCLLMFCNRQK
mmetsp:Transcript_53470/g.106431  ORF Transcript_53470/g.106431 Transcript_53470/m.106431 type:complete len:237 (+) Transcript_53470:179-889(+)